MRSGAKWVASVNQMAPSSQTIALWPSCNQIDGEPPEAGEKVRVLIPADGLLVLRLVCSARGRWRWRYEVEMGEPMTSAQWRREARTFDTARCIARAAEAEADVIAATEALRIATLALEAAKETARARLAPEWAEAANAEAQAREEKEAAKRKATERTVRAAMPKPVADLIEALNNGVNWDAQWQFHTLVEKPGHERLALISLPARQYWSGIGRRANAPAEYHLASVEPSSLTGTERLSEAKRLSIQTGAYADSRYCDTAVRRWGPKVLAEVLEAADRLARPISSGGTRGQKP